MYSVDSRFLRNIQGFLRKIRKFVSSEYIVELNQLLEDLKLYLPKYCNIRSMSDNTLRGIMYDRTYNPHLYYNFLFEDKTISIIFDNTFVTDKGILRNQEVYFYHIVCNGFVPVYPVIFRHSLNKYKDCFLGNFESFDDVLLEYKRIIYSLVALGCPNYVDNRCRLELF